MRFLVSLICLFFLSLTIFSQKLVYDASFAPVLNGSVSHMEILNDGKILIAGGFSSVNGVTRYKIARLNADGSLDESFNANSAISVTEFFSPVINSVQILPDGKILLSGFLAQLSGLYNTTVLRLNADGTRDTTQTSFPYRSDSTFAPVNKAAQLASGKILMCGEFQKPNDNLKPWLARYNNNGTYDSTFTTAINSRCYDVEVLPDGKYLVAGYYTTIDGNSAVGLTRFNADDTIDTTFNGATYPGSAYRQIEVLSDGKIIAFQISGGNGVVSRLNSDGRHELTFPTAFFIPDDVALQPNGKTFVVGEYRDIFGQSSDMNRFNTDGSHDPSLDRLFFSGPTSSDSPKAVAVTADGKVIVGGAFTNFFTFPAGTINRPYLVRFTPQAIPIKPKYDFDGDGKDDMAVFRPSDRVWYLNQSTAGFSATQFGLSTDVPVAADYDRDGKADIAVFRDGAWYWLRSSDNVFAYKVCGQAGDIPQAPGDYHGNGSFAFLVFRPSTAKFYTQGAFQPNASEVEFRNMTMLPNDKPVIADYDGDGKEDLAVFRDGHWYYMASNNLETRHYQWGLAGDKAVVGDFDGDLRADLAIFRPSNGVWYINKSTEGFYAVQWGINGDIPVPADYDGDGKTDIAVFRPSDGVWYEMRSTNASHIEQFGLAGDIPAQLR
jgi:uncharacterized delta-60 repeat protein